MSTADTMRIAIILSILGLYLICLLLGNLYKGPVPRLGEAWHQSSDKTKTFVYAGRTNAGLDRWIELDSAAVLILEPHSEWSFTLIRSKNKDKEAMEFLKTKFPQYLQ